VSAYSEEVEILIFGVGEISYGTEMSQIISVIKPSEKMDRISESIPFVGLFMNPGPGAELPLGGPDARTSSICDNARGEAATVILVDTDRGMMGVYVESVQGVRSIPLRQIRALPEFLMSRMETDCIWGIGEFEKELIVLLDLGEYLAHISREETHT